MAAPPAMPYGVAQEPTPVFSSPELPSLVRRGKGALPIDRCGQVRQLEFVALTGTSFRLHDCQNSEGTEVCRVTTSDYDPASGISLYLDSSLLARGEKSSPPRTRRIPDAAVILRRLQQRIGTPYVWGGNLLQGVRGGDGRLFQGVDCSGLLYEATDGATPRNTSHLVSFGNGVPIEGLPAEAIAARLRPLDLIVWEGHVIIVLDGERTIESRLACGRAGGGVVMRPLLATLREVGAGRRGVDRWPGSDPSGGKLYVVRRWYGGPS
jgi:cell wall-associated NlpC family hydrolase